VAAIPTESVIGVIGAGAMGAGIAQVAAQAGHKVLLTDSRAGAARTAIGAIAKTLGGLVAKGRMSEAQQNAVVERLTAVDDLAALAPAALVIEAIVEDLAAKREVFAKLEASIAQDAILATNTSSLSVAAIARGLKHPARVVGMHFFNPAPLLPLVEVISGVTTDPAIAARVFDTAIAWGKSPVHARSTPGFIVNRIARPYYAEALRLLQEHAANPATIDAVMREGCGFRMGPCELMDLVGHDVNFAVTRSVHAAYFGDPRFQPSVVQQEMVEGGLLGRKSGRGFFDYREGATNPTPATAAPAPRPARAVIEGDLGPARALVVRLEAAGIPFAAAEAGTPAIVLDGAILRLTEGRPATLADERNLVLFDVALDYATARRIALAPSDRASAEAREAAVGFFQALGFAVSVIADTPGLIVARTLAMLVNEAMSAVQEGVASAEDIDVAMTKGVNYPRGPLGWGAAFGHRRLVAILDNLASTYGEDRYRTTLHLRKLAAREGHG
jgi:3-hydroxybutyryl-CoA dehydrogenase